MSFLEEGANGRVPTAQTFPPTPTQAQTETPRTPLPEAKAEDYSANRSTTFSSFLKAVATMGQKERSRLGKLGDTLQEWWNEVVDIRTDIEILMEQIGALTGRLEAIPFQSIPASPKSEVNDG